MATRAGQLPRALHPLAWWGWAIGLAVAASMTTNPLLLALILAVVWVVVIARRSDSPWSRAFRIYVALAVVIVIVLWPILNRFLIKPAVKRLRA